jgi:asparaginyl-tRNA synthetase
MNISRVSEFVGRSLEIRGWVYRKRESKGVIFLIIRDAEGIVQCVVKKNSKEFEKAKKLTIESSVIIKGKVYKEKRSPSGYEMGIEKLEIVNLAERFPITKDQSAELLLDLRHLWIRSRRMNAIFRVRHTVLGAIHKFFRDRGYYEFHPPIFQPIQCEGGSTLFEVKYFDDITYLSQSWQLYAEAAVFALERVYDIAPSFRAERSKTSRHLTEYWHAEMEAAWMDLKEVIKIAKQEIKFIIREVLKHNRKELEFLGQDVKKLEKISKKRFPTITYDQALEILRKKEGMRVPWGKDLRTIEEDRLMKHFDTPVVVTHYPKKVRGFYQPVDPKNPKVCLSFDMLAPEGYGELIGGSQRDTNLKDLIKYLKAQGEDPKKYNWYLDLRRYGSVPHSGYGLGVERLISWLCKLDNIKDAIPFPRTMVRFKP